MIEQQKASAIDFLLIFLEFIRSRAAELDAWYEDLDAMIDNNGDDNYDFDSGDPEGIDF